MIVIRTGNHPEPTPMQFAIMVRDEVVAYIKDRPLARAIAHALADATDNHPIVWDDGNT